MCALTLGDASQLLIICIQYCDKAVRTEFIGRHLSSGKSQHHSAKRFLQTSKQLLLVVEVKYFEISQPSLKLNSLAINKKMHPNAKRCKI